MAGLLNTAVTSLTNASVDSLVNGRMMVIVLSYKVIIVFRDYRHRPQQHPQHLVQHDLQQEWDERCRGGDCLQPPSERHLPPHRAAAGGGRGRPSRALHLLEEVRLLLVLLLPVPEAPGDKPVRGLRHLPLRHPGPDPEEGEAAVLPGLSGPQADEVHQLPRELPVRLCRLLYPLRQVRRAHSNLLTSQLL